MVSNMPIEHVRLSAKARDHLIALKRRTGIENWNILCRWALCYSLAEKSVPPETKIVADSNIEMTWRTFAGQHEELYWGLMRQRCATDGLDPTDDEAVGNQFRLHLHRGISYLVADRGIQSVGDLVHLAAPQEGEQPF